MTRLYSHRRHRLPAAGAVGRQDFLASILGARTARLSGLAEISLLDFRGKSRLAIAKPKSECEHSIMNERVARLSREALKLSAEERLLLVEEILASVRASASSVEAAWAQEIGARITAYERGALEVHDADGVIDEARQTLKR
ncbi:MAG TPA: addiction module protein [Hyphomicrobiaceae bacterium]|nr:addiction module protein [Hyphomicrobiaceae bacterium]